MLLKLLKFMIYAAIATGAVCPNPRCGSTNTDKRNGIWHCYDCGKEW